MASCNRIRTWLEYEIENSGLFHHLLNTVFFYFEFILQGCGYLFYLSKEGLTYGDQRYQITMHSLQRC